MHTKKLKRKVRLRRRCGMEPLDLRCLMASVPLSFDGDSYGQLPLSFEPNEGQARASVDYLSRAAGYTLFLSQGDAFLNFAATDSEDGLVLKMHPVGGNAQAGSSVSQPLGGMSNYFVGSDPSAWRSDIGNFGRVEYDDVYPGIDLAYYGNRQQLEYDFIVEPHADPGDIAMRFDGAESLSLNAAGELVVHTVRGDLVVQAPLTYQTINGSRRIIPSHYVLNGDQVTFALGAYDASQPLVIDPVLIYSTYLGGFLGDEAFAVAVDDEGSAYITGETGSTNFPTTPGAFRRTHRGGNTVTDVFVTKLNASGKLVYSTFIGGNSDDHGTGIAVDKAGNAYMTGWTGQSDDYPTTPGAFRRNYNHGVDGFVTKFNATGSRLLYSTYLGGGAADFPHGIAVDANGCAYVAGETTSTDFPTKNPIQNGILNSYADGFLTKFNPAGTALVYSTYVRGEGGFEARGEDVIHGVAVDRFGNATVVGETTSTQFPTTPGAFQRRFEPESNRTTAFVTKINAAGNGYRFSTYLSGSINDVAHGVAVDHFGNVYVTGETFGNTAKGALTDASFFPVTPDAPLGVDNYGDLGLSDAFVTKFTNEGTLVYSTRIGGGGRNTTDRGTGIAVDPEGNAYITGYAKDTSTPFPTRRAFIGTPPGLAEAFVARINAEGSDWDYSSFLAGRGTDQGYGIAVDANGAAYVVGSTLTERGQRNNFPTVNPIKANGPNEFDTDGFVARVRPVESGAGVFSFAPGIFSSTETGKVAQLYVRRLNGTALPATVSYATSSLTAKAGSDYKFTSGVLAFAAGEFEKTIYVPILNDSVKEGTQTFRVTLSKPTGGAKLASAQSSVATVEIIDDERKVFNDDVDDHHVLTGTSASVRVSNVNATSEDAEPIHVGAAGGKSLWWAWTAPSNGLVTLDTVGTQFDTVLAVYSYRKVIGSDDRPNALDGSSRVQFMAHQGVHYFFAVDSWTDGFLVPGSGIVHLNLKLEERGVFGFSTSSYTINEKAGTATITVKRFGGSTGPVSVQYSMTNGTAGSADYTNVQGTLEFFAGQTTKTFKIPIKNDSRDEQNETIFLRLGTATGGAMIGSNDRAILRIIDNDPAPAPGRASSTAAAVPAERDNKTSLANAASAAAYYLASEEQLLGNKRRAMAVDRLFAGQDWAED